jgi:hypothetical protein
MTLSLSLADFFTKFPELATTPDDSVTMFYDVATSYISAEDYGWLNGASRGYALELLTAHMINLSCLANNGTGVLISASEGSVNAAFMPPPVKSALSYWLNQSHYGQRLLALLSIKAAGGIYSAGSRVTQSIRKFNGSFTR